MVKKMKSYSELIKIPTFEERLAYLQDVHYVGAETFGGFRRLNQELYLSKRWKSTRNLVIIRDNGKDMAIPYEEYVIKGSMYVHHINPLTPEDLFEFNSKKIFDLENLILVSRTVHDMIHYGGKIEDIYNINERRPGDTIGWSPLRRD